MNRYAQLTALLAGARLLMPAVCCAGIGNSQGSVFNHQRMKRTAVASVKGPSTQNSSAQTARDPPQAPPRRRRKLPKTNSDDTQTVVESSDGLPRCAELQPTYCYVERVSLPLCCFLMLLPLLRPHHNIYRCLSSGHSMLAADAPGWACTKELPLLLTSSKLCNFLANVCRTAMSMRCCSAHGNRTFTLRDVCAVGNSKCALVLKLLHADWPFLLTAHARVSAIGGQGSHMLPIHGTGIMMKNGADQCMMTTNCLSC